MTYDRDAAEAAELENWRKHVRDERQRHLVQILIALGAGVVIGIGFFQKNTYDAARNHPEDAAQALCSRGYVVTDPSNGPLCP